jgi:hypothetical protein
VEGVQLTKRILWHESKLKNLSKVFIPVAEETVAQATQASQTAMRKPRTPLPLKFDLDLDAVDDRLLEKLHIPAAEETVAQATQVSEPAMRKPLPLPLKFDLDLDAVDDRLFEKLEKVGVQVEAKSRRVLLAFLSVTNIFCSNAFLRDQERPLAVAFWPRRANIPTMLHQSAVGCQK